MWSVCHRWWASIDALPLTMAHCSYWGSLFVLYLLSVWEGIERHRSTRQLHVEQFYCPKHPPNNWTLVQFFSFLLLTCLNYWHVCCPSRLNVSCSVVSDSGTLWTIAHQTSPSMAFSRQEYWSAVPFPSPGDLPDPGIKPRSPLLQVDSLPSSLRMSYGWKHAVCCLCRLGSFT